LTIKNERVFYSALLSVGSNNQELNLIVDTGSSDAWIPSIDANIRASLSLSNPCTSYGSFDHTQSTSFNFNLSAPMFYLAYLDGTTVRGFWGTDTVKFGSSSVSDFSFAVANLTSSDMGVLGIGLADLESTSISARPYTYENFPIRLKATGQIQTNAYSLYLNDVTAKEGVLLFGAVDHAKYIGTLQSVPVVRLADSYMSKPRRLLIVMHGILFAADDEESIRIDKPVVALLDSGSTFSYLPLDIILALANNLKATWNKDMSLFNVEC
ncbi:acid protease, partial [Metschnikowia bicuspidata]